MTKTKKILLSILIVLMLLCIASDCLYLVIKYCFPEKMIANTFNVDDLISKKDNGETVSLGKVIELNYYANEDLSGVEMLEIKLNTLKNEKSSSVFSTGMQIVADSQEEKLTSYWKNISKGGNGVGNAWNYYDITFNGKVYYYNVDGVNFAYTASLPINEDSYFLITIGEDQFRMHPRKKISDDKKTLEPYYVTEYSDKFLWMSTAYNYLVDWNYIASILLKSVQSLEPGYDGSLTFKFGDIFDYYKYDEKNKSYEKIERTKSGALIEQVINNYYTIKVNTYYSGAIVATDSLFNMIENKSDYNKTNSTEMNDYSLDRQIISLTEKHFLCKFVEGTDIDFKLQLKDEVKEILQNRTKYKLYIKINKEYLTENAVNYAGLIYDDFLTEDLIYKVEVI